MNKETIKQLAFCEAFDYEFGGDSYTTMESITRDNDCFDEWQGCEDSKHEDPALEDGFRIDAELMIIKMLEDNGFKGA